MIPIFFVLLYPPQLSSASFVCVNEPQKKYRKVVEIFPPEECEEENR